MKLNLLDRTDSPKVRDTIKQVLFKKFFPKENALIGSRTVVKTKDSQGLTKRSSRLLTRKIHPRFKLGPVKPESIKQGNKFTILAVKYVINFSARFESYFIVCKICNLSTVELVI